MEEKERYELLEVFEDGSFCWYLKDNDTKLLKPLVNLYNCVDLLNQQDKQINELKEYLKSVQYCKTQINEQDYRLRKENLLLTKQLHDLSKKIVEEIKKVSDTAILGSGEIYDYTITAKNLDTILKKYGGENETTK